MDSRASERLRYIVNCFTRLRYVDAEGRLVLRAKGSPQKSSAQIAHTLVRGAGGPLARDRAWFSATGRRSAYFRNADVIGLDTGCVWGGRLTALRLDAPDAEPVQVPCAAPSSPLVKES